MILNGLMHLFPDKSVGLAEMARVLRPGGRLQIGDIMVQKTVLNPVGVGAVRADLERFWDKALAAFKQVVEQTNEEES